MPFNDQNEVHFYQTEHFRNNLKHVVIHAREYPNAKARLAIVLIEKWGLVAAAPDGEDSAGRAKLRKLSAAELVEEAIATASIAINAFRERGWMLEVPGLEEEKD